MSSVAEVLFGKPWKQWGAMDVWLLRFLTALAGVLSWCLLVVLIEFLQGRSVISTPLSYSIAIAYGTILFAATFFVLPSVESNAKTPPAPPNEIAPPGGATMSSGVVGLSVLELIFGITIIIIAIAFPHPNRHWRWVNVVWPILGGTLALGAVLAFFRTKWSRFLLIGLQPVTGLLLGAPILPFALHALRRGHTIWAKLWPSMILVSIILICAGIAFGLTRPGARSYFQRS